MFSVGRMADYNMNRAHEAEVPSIDMFAIVCYPLLCLAWVTGTFK